MKQFKFNKSEKLCSKIQIDALFKKGKGFNAGFIRVMHNEITNEHSDTKDNNCQVLISVSKKRIKTASARNPIKRKIREAYRLNKAILMDCLVLSNKKINIAIIYASDKPVDYKIIESKIILSLQRLANIYGENN